MKKINRLSDLMEIKKHFQEEFGSFLEAEFLNLYDYSNNGESIEDFVLDSFQTILFFEKKEEIEKILDNPFELEFIEEVNLNGFTILRVGIFREHNVQLCYFMKS
ncbi:hypothetical protein [Gracilibacillus kekensis]|uniref:Uncharacterized protein n=1 Tax=Gracilibacillus kekensis TaxID=1027249 RepID=A0A1M7QQC2_9BACI|nr:hypothetical protein [Gracilibacillus kekensis]SHN33774.1 hypothetical protein SAMN05216179_3467 [Gracilibacillus kekensis]